MLGLSKNSVMLSEYSSEWAILFEIEKINLYKCIRETVIDIQHVGSTAISGMYAKPVIDIVIAINDLKDGFKSINDVESIGYHFKGALGKSNRFFFWKGNEDSNTHNLHIVEYADKSWENLILFRDYLNEHSDYRDKYLILKTELANAYKDDRATYTEKKAKFILEVIQLAKRAIQKD